MVLQTSGKISTQDIRTEFGIATNTLIGINQQSVALLGRTARTETKLTVFYGASNLPGSFIYLNSTTSDANLKNVFLIAIDISGLNLIVIPQPGTNGRMIYNITQSNVNYTLTQTQITKGAEGAPYGDLDWIVVLKDYIFVGGSYKNITGMNNNTYISPCTININSKTVTQFYNNMTISTGPYSFYYLGQGSTGYDYFNNIIYMDNAKWGNNPYYNWPNDSYFRYSAFLLNKSTNNMPTLSSYPQGGKSIINDDGYFNIDDKAYICFYNPLQILFAITHINKIDSTTQGPTNPIHNVITCYNPSTDSWHRVLVFPSISYGDKPRGNGMVCSDTYLYFIIPSSNTITSTDGTVCRRIMRIDLLTGISYPMANPSSLSDDIYCIAFDTKRRWLYACGKFKSSYNSYVNSYNISYWSEIDNKWNFLLGLDNICYLLTYSEYYDNLYLSGLFTNVNGKPCNGFAVFHHNPVTKLPSIDINALLFNTITSTNYNLFLNLDASISGINSGIDNTGSAGSQLNYYAYSGSTSPSWYGIPSGSNTYLGVAFTNYDIPSGKYSVILDASKRQFLYNMNGFGTLINSNRYLTFELWIKPLGYQNSCIIFANNYVKSNLNIGLYGWNNPFLWLSDNNIVVCPVSSSYSNTDPRYKPINYPYIHYNWYHICIVFDRNNNTGRLYVNANYVAYKEWVGNCFQDYNSSNGTGGTWLSFGLNGGTNDAYGNKNLNYFNGDIGLIRIYGYQLNEYQILMNYKATCRRYGLS